jgi:hypothetical protein
VWHDNVEILGPNRRGALSVSVVTWTGLRTRKRLHLPMVERRLTTLLRRVKRGANANVELVYDVPISNRGPRSRRRRFIVPVAHTCLKEDSVIVRSVGFSVVNRSRH